VPTTFSFTQRTLREARSAERKGTTRPVEEMRARPLEESVADSTGAAARLLAAEGGEGRGITSDGGTDAAARLLAAKGGEGRGITSDGGTGAAAWLLAAKGGEG